MRATAAGLKRRLGPECTADVVDRQVVAKLDDLLAPRVAFRRVCGPGSPQEERALQILAKPCTARESCPGVAEARGRLGRGNALDEVGAQCLVLAVVGLAVRGKPV